MLPLLALLAGCTPFGPWSDEGTDDPDADGARVVASPGALDFGAVSVNEDGEARLPLTLYNLGDTPETVTGHDEPRGDGAAFSVAADPILELAPGASVALEVVFAPGTDAAYVAELLIDPSEELVRLSGVGTAPVLETGEPNLPPVVLGCAGEGRVPLANAGSEPLVFAGATVASSEFAVVDLPDALAPGETGDVLVRFAPAGGGPRGTTLLLRTDDPARPEAGVALSALGYEGERVVESFRYAPTDPTDILFVVDTGGGMAAHLQKAEAVVPSFVDALRDANLDYQLVGLSGEGPCPGPLGFATRSDTSLVAERVLEWAFDGGTGAWDADLLGLAVAALEETGPGACLDGFRRDDADLHVVLVSDNDAQGDVDAAAADLEDAVGDAGLRISALLPGSDCGGATEGYARVAETHGGTVEDLCAPDWTDAFLAFASQPAGGDAVRYALAEVPVVATLEVEVEGAAWTDWSYDADANEVVFDGGQTPALGAEVVVEYVSAVACQ